MSTFINAIKGEHIKTVKSGIPLTSYLLTLLIPAVYLIVIIVKAFEEFETPAEPQYVFYEVYRDLLSPFLSGIFPIMLIVNAARIAQLEHKNNTWQLMETQPVEKGVLFLSKFAKLLDITVKSILLYFVVIVLIACIKYAITPSHELIFFSVDAMVLIRDFIKTVLSSLFLLTIIYCFSVRFSNIFLSIIMGIAILLSAPILSAFQKMPKWHPISLIQNVADKPSDIGYWITHNEITSILATFILLWITTLWFSYKTRRWKNTPALRITGFQFFPIILLSFLLFLNLKPKQMLPSSATIIKGQIPEKTHIDQIYILDGVIQDTLYTIPVENNSFEYTIEEELPLNFYRIVWNTPNGSQGSDVIFSSNDIVEIQFADAAKDKKTKILGTRIAENNLNVQLAQNYKMSKWYSENADPEKAKELMKYIKKDYKSDHTLIKQFYTADNYIMRDDFASIQIKENVYTYALLWENYKQTVLRTNPDFEYREKTIEDIIDVEINANDLQLVNTGSKPYLEFLKNKWIASDTTDVSQNIKIVNALKKVNDKHIKESLAKYYLDYYIQTTSDYEELVQLESNFLPMFQTPRLQKYFSGLLAKTKNLTTGSPALSFTGMTPDGAIKTLEDYKDKYVIIDFWASWCGPCLREAPIYEEFAIKNKNADIVFISLSIDEKETNWRKKVKLNDRNVVQLYALNQPELNDFYQISSIPRFIVIDKEGKIVNKNMSFPSDPNFQSLLDKYLSN